MKQARRFILFLSRICLRRVLQGNLGRSGRGSSPCLLSHSVSSVSQSSNGGIGEDVRENRLQRRPLHCVEPAFMPLFDSGQSVHGHVRAVSSPTYRQVCCRGIVYCAVGVVSVKR